MAATILEGGPIADRIKAELKEQVKDLQSTKPPRLVSVLAGDNPGAKYYAKSQQRDCEALGIGYELKQLPADVDEDEMRSVIDELNEDETVTGIILLVPVPEHLDARALQAQILPAKDVDGVHPTNLGRVVQGDRTLAPCTAQAAVTMVEESGVEIEGAEVVMVGHSEIVGKPTALLLLEPLATVTVCHIGTKDTAAHTRNADIVIVATGVPGLVKPDWIKEGALVVDVGINRVKDEEGNTKIVGDVEPGVQEVAGILTPVPGGVGAVTSAMLMKNTVAAAQTQAGGQ
ncbi:MAG: bifunctional 5,10-methylenetetrahydrofolate dehydrogenase/5,10-methenyltetrahydrofolate cyclohydrolase [Armatimonadota bacterium]